MCTPGAAFYYYFGILGPQHEGITTELAAGQLSRFFHKGPVASKFAGFKPSGISRVWCNVGRLPQA